MTDQPEYSINAFPTYHDSIATADVNVTEFHIGGQLISRSTLQSDPDRFISAIQGVLRYNTAFSGYSMNVSRANNRVFSDNAANPAWQKAAVSAVVGIYESSCTLV